MTQLSFLLALQDARTPVLTALMAAATYLASEEFYLLAVPLVFWVGNRRWGFRLLIAVMISFWLNGVLKDLCHTPRPWMAHGDLIEPLLKATGGGFSFPSGHSQSAVAMWFFLAWRGGRVWHWAAATLAVALVGLSRMYLGLHWPVDVAGGFALGALLLALCGLVWWAGDEHGVRIGPGWGVVTVLAGPALMLILAQFTQQAFEIAGFLWGAGLGYVATGQRVQPGAEPPRPIRLRYAAVGVAGCIVVYSAFKLLWPSGIPAHTLRSLLLGLWITGAVPFLVQRATDRPRGPRVGEASP